jgi:signal transduction histidine kinase
LVAELLSMPLQRMAGAIADLEAAGWRRRSAAGGACQVVELGGAARAALAPWRAPLRDAGRGAALDWLPSGTVAVEADPARLAQVLGNLVGNAAEHGVGGVELRLLPLPEGARLEVRNRNAPAEPGRGGSGRGRGLRIAARATEEMGGRLSVSSDNGVTVARLDLPAARGLWGDPRASRAVPAKPQHQEPEAA